MLTTETGTLETTHGKTYGFKVKRRTEAEINNLAASGVSLDWWFGHLQSSLFAGCGLFYV